MMIKGHHIEDLDTVIVMESDQSLLSKDFKAQETLLAQMGQVIGRSGRGQTQGVVLIQTRHPEHPLWTFVSEHNYLGAATYLLSQRRQYELPPYAYQLAIHFSAATMDKAQATAQSLLRLIQGQLHSCSLIGPMPSLLAKLNGAHRVVLVAQASRATDIQVAIQLLASVKRQDRRYANMVFERDPVEL